MGKKEQIIYALPNFAIYSLVGFPMTFLFYFYADELMLQLEFLRYLILAIGMLIGAILSPIIGKLSDKTKSKHGKRTPWILVGLPFTSVLFWLLAIPFPIRYFVNTALAVTIYTLIIWTIYSVFLNIMNVPYTGMMPEITKPEERTQMSFFYNMIGTIGTVSIFFIPTMLLGIMNTYAFVTLFYGVILAVLMLITVFYLKEYKRTDFQVIETEKISLKEVFKNKEFRKFEAAQFLWNFAFNILLSSIISFASMLLGLTDEAQLMPFMIFLILTVGPSVVFWLNKSDPSKFGKKNTLVFALVWMGAIFPFTILLFFIFINGISLWVPFFILIGLIAFGLPVILLMPYSILMDITEEGMEASYMGSNHVILNLSGACGNFVMVILSLIFFAYPVMPFFIIGPILGTCLFIAALIANKINVVEKG